MIKMIKLISVFLLFSLCIIMTSCQKNNAEKADNAEDRNITESELQDQPSSIEQPHYIWVHFDSVDQMLKGFSDGKILTEECVDIEFITEEYRNFVNERVKQNSLLVPYYKGKIAYSSNNNISVGNAEAHLCGSTKIWYRIETDMEEIVLSIGYMTSEIASQVGTYGIQKLKSIHYSMYKDYFGDSFDESKLDTEIKTVKVGGKDTQISITLIPGDQRRRVEFIVGHNAFVEILVKPEYIEKGLLNDISFAELPLVK